MIRRSIELGIFHHEVTKGFLSLIPKEGNSLNLNNQWPIKLLTFIYKVFAKTLHRRLQLILSDVIRCEQMIYLPLRFILENIVQTQETLHQARSSRQPMVFLKLDFSKAYNNVSWHFFFHDMEKTGINTTFIGCLKLFFDNANVVLSTLRGVWVKSSQLREG